MPRSAASACGSRAANRQPPTSNFKLQTSNFLSIAADFAAEEDGFLGIEVFTWDESDGDGAVDDVERSFPLFFAGGVDVFATEAGDGVVFE